MRSSLNIRSPIFGAGLFVAGLAAGAALASWASTPTHADIRKGATLASFLPEAVMSLTYSTPEGMTTVQRSAPGAPFQVLSTYADGRPAQRCSASADMEGHLDSLAALTARRRLSLEQREGEFPVQLGVIEVRDAVIGEPSGPVLVFTNKNRTALAVILDGRAAEVTLQAVKLKWLETICSGLTQGSRPNQYK
jgi:hypothetical protein